MGCCPSRNNNRNQKHLTSTVQTESEIDDDIHERQDAIRNQEDVWSLERQLDDIAILQRDKSMPSGVLREWISDIVNSAVYRNNKIDIMRYINSMPNDCKFII